MSYVFLYPSFVYFYEYNYITFIFYEILYPTVSTFVIAIFPNLTIKNWNLASWEKSLNRFNIILTPCLVLVIESIFFHRQQRIQFPSLRSLFIASRFGSDASPFTRCQPANRAETERRRRRPCHRPWTLSPPAERSSLSPPPSLMFSRFPRRPRSSIASIIDRFLFTWRVQTERPAVEPAETRGLIIPLGSRTCA